MRRLLLLLVLFAVAACETGPPRAHPVERWPVPLGPYRGTFDSEVDAAGFQRRLQREAEDALTEIDVALGVRIDRPERLLVRLVDGGASRAWWTVDEAWVSRVRRRRVSIHVEPILRGETDLPRALRGALTEAVLVEQVRRDDDELPRWVTRGAPLYLSGRNGWLRRALLFDPTAAGDDARNAIAAASRFSALQELGGPRRLARLIPALSIDGDESAVLPRVFESTNAALQAAFAEHRRAALEETREEAAARAGEMRSYADPMLAAEAVLVAAVDAAPRERVVAFEATEAAGRRPLRGDLWGDRKAAALRAVGRHDEAAATLVRRLRLWPPAPHERESPVRTTLAEVHLDRDDPAAALACLESVPLDDAPGDPRRARVLVRAGRALGLDRVVATAAAADDGETQAWLAARREQPIAAERAERLVRRLKRQTADGASSPAVLAVGGEADRIGERMLPLLERVALDEHHAAIPAVVAFGARLPGDGPTRWLRTLAALDRDDVSPVAVRALIARVPNSLPTLRYLDAAVANARGRAALAEATHGIPMAVLDASPDLLERLDGERVGPRVTALESLPALVGEKALPVLARFAEQDPAPLARIAAIRALAELGAAGLDAIATRRGDSVGAVRAEAIRVLAKQAPDRLAGTLAEWMRSPNARVRAEVLNAIVRSSAPGAVEISVEALADSDPGMRRLAEAMLTTLGPEKAAPPLIEVYRTGWGPIGTTARVARLIGSLAGRDFGHDPSLTERERSTVAAAMLEWWRARYQP